MAQVDRVTDQIIAAAIRIHAKYGPGLLESVYSRCLAQELLERGLEREIGKPLELDHKGLRIHRAYVLDLLVENCVIVESKCVDKIAPIHVAQLLTYLRLTGLTVGLVLNFKVKLLKYGIRRVVNGYDDGEQSDDRST
jgi:GxxExxY protein